MSSVLADLRYAWRRLIHEPASVVVAVVSIGFGVGVGTAIFGVVDRVLLADLPYPDPERVIAVTDRSDDGAPLDVTYGTYVELAQRNRSFETLAIADRNRWRPTLAGAGEPERVSGDLVSADYFRVLGVAPAVGRGFDATDDVVGASSVAIIDAALAVRQFGSAEAALGRQVSLDTESYTIVGVMPEAFENALNPAVEIWAPRRYDAAAPFDTPEWGHHLRMVGRLRADSTLDEARRDIDAIARNPVAEFARPGHASLGNGLALEPLQASAAIEMRPTLLTTLGAVLLLLAIACANVTNILLARAVARRGELAIRAAVGAEQHQIVRQLFAESALVALLGGVLGIGVAAFAGRALLALAPEGLPSDAAGFDARVFAFALAMTALVAVVVGLAPALRARELGSHVGLMTGARATDPGLRVLRQSLVVGQVALATVLLACAGLLLRSVEQLLDVPTGFDGSRAVAMQVVVTGSGIRSSEEAQTQYERVLGAVLAVPGVVDAALTSQLPLSGDNDVYGVLFESVTTERTGPIPSFRYAVTPGWFETMGIPLKRGRLLGTEDRRGAPQSILINESFAARRFPGRDPIGERVRIGPYISRTDLPAGTIVGVVGDVKQASVASPSPDAFYVPMGQWIRVDDVQSLVVRTEGDPAALVPSIKEAVWSVNPTLPLERITTMSDLVARSEAQRTFALRVFAAFGLAALLLAGIGVYGVIEARVAERTRELGLRAAVGATPAKLAALVVGQGLALTAVGVVIGIGAAVGATQAIASLLFGVEPFDLVTYAGVVALLLGVAFVACYAPAFRAARIDPAITLRAD